MSCPERLGGAHNLWSGHLDVERRGPQCQKEKRQLIYYLDVEKGAREDVSYNTKADMNGKTRTSSVSEREETTEEISWWSEDYIVYA